MRTEILVPFEFDSGPVEAMLQRDGERVAMDHVHSIVEKGLLSAMPSSNRGYYGNGKPAKVSDIDWRRFVNDHFDKWLDAHHDEIVDEAALLMAMRAGRKKAWRDVLAEYRDESDG